ncbi:MAG: copper chaperone PCu(A)C [Anaerolineales bacterium]|nr:copper chaperone PCu(A)C [Anaerolineales bacterium]
MHIHKTLLFAALTLALVACAPGNWHVHQAWARPTPAGGTAAVYFLLHNATNTDDALLGASASIARAAEMHENVAMSDEQRHGQAAGSHEDGHGHEDEGHGHEADVMMMRPVPRVELAAGHEIRFEPGGYHIMLIDLQRDLVAGESFEVTLHFEHAEDIVIRVTVQE